MSGKRPRPIQHRYFHQPKTRVIKDVIQIEMDHLVACYQQEDWMGVEQFGTGFVHRFPHESFGWKLLGSAALQRNEPEKAIAYLYEAVIRSPAEAEIYNNIGVAYRKMADFIRAESAFQKALSLQPDYAEAWSNLGNVLGDMDRHREAVECYPKALALKPDYAVGWNNHANALNMVGCYADALSSAEKALTLSPAYFEAYSNRGNALKRLGRTEEAIASYRHALDINPCYANGHNNLGATLKDIGRLQEAAQHLRRAQVLNPKQIDTYHNLGLTLGELGQWEDALASQKAGLQLQPDHFEMRGAMMFSSNFHHPFQIQEYLAEAAEFGKRAAALAQPFTDWSDAQARSEVKLLKVGFVSGDLNHHPVGFFIENFIRHLAEHRIILIAYATQVREEPLTERIRPYFSVWHSLVGLSDAAAAQLIHDDGVHVLIDLAGHTGHNRLPMFAWKPAPVQASWLGYFASTGVKEVDYFIGDPYVHQPEDRGHFVEKPWVLPETFCCFTPPDVAIGQPIPLEPLPALRNGFITFGSFNKLSKMNDAVAALWARVLRAVPNSRLFLNGKELSDASVQDATYARFAALGIESGRIRLADWQRPRIEHLKLYSQIDISLDTFPYVGGTTSVESLWMGVPVLTRKGDRFLSRIGESINQNAGLADWVAADDDDYVAKAAAFAADVKSLTELRGRLRAQVMASPLFDAPRFAQHFAQGLWGMWLGQIQLPIQKVQSQQAPSQQDMQEIAQAFNAGEYELALRRGQALTGVLPLHPYAWKVVGTVLTQTGQAETAIPFLEKAFALAPLDYECASNLGVTLKHCGRLEAALQVYQQAVKLKPDYGIAWSNLGDTLRELKRYDEAIHSCQQAVTLLPDYAEGWNNMGCALAAKNETAPAVLAFQRALELDGDYADAHSNLSSALSLLERPAEAESHARKSLSIKSSAMAWVNLGVSFSQSGKETEALNCFTQAIQIKPDCYEAYFNAGNVLSGTYQLREALAFYRKAIEIRPEAPETYFNMAGMWVDAGDLKHAHEAHRRAIELDTERLEPRSALLFTLNYLPELTQSEYLQEARQFAAVATAAAAGKLPGPKIPLGPSDKLRVGIVSGDLIRHPVGHFLESILTQDLPKVEWYLYPTRNKADDLSIRLGGQSKAWRSLVGLSDLEAAQLIRRDELHLLLDLSGHTGHGHLSVFAYRPAPVQAHWLGYFASTGMSEMDYFIGDPTVMPAGEESHFVEQPWHLPETFCCFTPPDVSLGVDIPVVELPALNQKTITFGSFNKLAKVNDAVVALWARVLQNVPNSRLFLSARELADKHVVHNIYKRFAQHGIAQERLLLADWKRSREAHLALYGQVDIALDPFPYVGGTTSVEALWMGVPVLTKRGDRYLSHIGESINQNAGLADWIAKDADDYVAKAVSFSANLAGLVQLRAGLRQQVLASPLFDAPRFARNFEAALWSMWHEYQEKQGKECA